MSTDDRLAQLSEELRRGQIIEARLKAFGEHLDGLCDGQTIYIDPTTAVVSALLHELIHRRYPSWSEARVRREEHRLIRNMTPNEVGQWFRRYQRTKITRARAKLVED